MLPILGQTFLIWQFVFSGLLLKTKFNGRHFGGAALVLLGLVVVNEPSAWALGPAGAREARSKAAPASRRATRFLLASETHPHPRVRCVCVALTPRNSPNPLPADAPPDRPLFGLDAHVRSG